MQLLYIQILKRNFDIIPQRSIIKEDQQCSVCLILNLIQSCLNLYEYSNKNISGDWIQCFFETYQKKLPPLIQNCRQKLFNLQFNVWKVLKIWSILDH